MRAGTPLTDEPVRCSVVLVLIVEARASAAVALDAGMGDVRPGAGRGSSGGASVAFEITGEFAGESFGKRVAAAEGDGTPELDVSDESVLTARAGGLAATAGGAADCCLPEPPPGPLIAS